ncbi:MAG: pseudaminic acid synthase [Methanobrevibacter thaueri]|uniref:pseudaminic acid synthase n=1 Tax=Methanobrevibacter thaueri TaxID=190975 RepID=UPI0026E96FBE|nr:pseudaminic acid synthase [Methanobrevibacter thaueri]MBE6496156.1 pseudaminic acid synthase [Methanobrevibacter thaueri]
MRIANKEIGVNQPTFIIAELSANHMNDFDVAVKTIKAMKEAGADAVKFQTYTPDTITIDCDNEYFQIKQGTIWDGQVLHELYEDAYMPWDWQPKLKKVAEDLGLIVFSSPFDKTSVDFLEDMDVPAYKIASFEITDIPLIEYVASKGKPIIISTGIASLEDIDLAVKTCLDAGNNKIALLKCTSSYPAPLDEINLNTIPDIEDKFGVAVGLSDHTLGGEVSTAAIALGAKIIEKHFILDRNMGGPDSDFSMEPLEFKQMVDSIRNVEKALGNVSYELSDKVKANREFSRSLFVVEDMKKGDIITEGNVRSIRPGFGLHPKYLKEILGKQVKKDLKKGTPFDLSFIN